MAKRNEENQSNYAEGLDCIDLQNYKGMFYNEDTDLKYQDQITGAHFEYKDMCRRLNKLKSILPVDIIKESKVITTLKESDNIRKKKNSIGKDLVKLIPKVQETRNHDHRPVHLYSNTISEIPGKSSKRESHKLNIQRNHSIGHKQPNINVLVKENMQIHKEKVKKTPRKTM